MKGMKALLSGESTYQRPERQDEHSKETWEGVTVVNFFKEYFPIPDKGPYGYTSWLRRVKSAGVKMYHAQKLVEIMRAREAWLLREKGEILHRGKWMFNRFRYEIKEQGIDRYISSQM